MPPGHGSGDVAGIHPGGSSRGRVAACPGARCAAVARSGARGAAAAHPG